MYQKYKKEQSHADPVLRIVQAAPDAMCLLAYDCQLNDVSRFCTDSDQCSILGIDPTFTPLRAVAAYMHHENYNLTHPQANCCNFVMLKPIYLKPQAFYSLLYSERSNILGPRLKINLTNKGYIFKVEEISFILIISLTFFIAL